MPDDTPPATTPTPEPPIDGAEAATNDGSAQEEPDATEPPVPRTPVERFLDAVDGAEALWTAKLDGLQRRLGVLQARAGEAGRGHRQAVDLLQKQLHDSLLKSKTLLQKWTKEKEARHAEKDWIADAWPVEVVLPPTVLRPFIKGLPPTPAELRARAAAANMQLALQAEAAEIASRMAQARQWSFVDGSYYYNAVTGESVWEKPAIMAYEPPLGWDKKKMAWRDGVVLTLLTDVTHDYVTEIVAVSPVDTNTETNDDANGGQKESRREDRAGGGNDDDGNDSDAEAEALDPLELRQLIESKTRGIALVEKQLAADKVALETLSEQLQKAVGYRLRAEAKSVDAEAQAYIAAERKKIAKKQRELAAAQAEAAARLEKEKEAKSGRKSPPKSPVAKAVEFEAPPEPDIIVPVDPDRLRLCAPASVNPSVRLHKVADAPYQHMLTLQTMIAAFVAKENRLWEAHDGFRERLEGLVQETRDAVTALDARKAELTTLLSTSEDSLVELQAPLPQPQLAPSDADDGESRFDVYDRAMAAWDAATATRVQEVATLEKSLREWRLELAHQPTDATRRDLAFFEAVQSAEITRGASLYAKKQEYLVWRTKSLLDRTAREERLNEMQGALQKLQAQLEAAKRLPLQALNVVERAKLEALADAQEAYFSAQLRTTLDEIAREHTSLEELMAYELHALAFHTARIDEEAALQAEAEGYWDDAEKERAELAAFEALQLVQRKADLPLSPSPSPARMELLRGFIRVNYDRERRWRQLAQLERTDETLWLEADEWLLTQQRRRFEAQLRDADAAHREALFTRDEAIDKLQAELEMAQRHKRQVEAEKASVLQILADVDRVVDKTKVETMHVLKAEIARLEAKLLAQQQLYETEIEDLVAEHTATRQALEAKLETTLADAVLRMQWLKAVKCELSDHKVLNEHLLAGIAALEKRRAAEINDMQARIVAQLNRIHRLEMWNTSLKQCIEASNDLMLKYQRDLDAKIREHRADQRHLRREIWHQRVSVQLLLANAQHLVRFFLQGVHHLCGHANDALRESSVIPILVALCKSPQVATDLRALATASLGKVAWNQPKSQRYVGWQAKTLWHAWVQRLTKEAYAVLEETKCDDFDSFVDPASATMNVSADPREHEKYQSHLDRVEMLRETRRWPHAPTPDDRSINEANLLAIGDTDGALAILLALCGAGHPTAVRESALASIAILALHARNTHLMGRTPGFLPTLLALGQAADTPTVQLHALHSVANVAHNNATNQSALLRLDAVPILLRICAVQRDVDVLDVATAALASLSQRHAGVAAALLAGTPSGLFQLLQLAQAPYLSDAVEDNKMDCIQGNVAACLVHLVEADSSGFRALCTAAPSTYVTLCLELCGAPFTTVQLAAVTVVGHLAHDDGLRRWLGDHDAIETLLAFLPASPPGDANGNTDDDAVAVADLLQQVAWALVQLSWDRDNQTRLVLHAPKLFAYAHAGHPHRLRVSVLATMANILFYHPENREVVLREPGQRWIVLFEALCRAFAERPGDQFAAELAEHAVRALTGLSYDAPFAAACDHVAVCVRVLAAADANEPIVLHALQWLTNLTVLDIQKSNFAHCAGATEAIVALCGAANRHVRDKAQTVLELVGDTKRPWR
ncbi:hypothetical protein ACHHYP_02931 [Achlya hypogyna]|uniref:WW domain-containing protein n=1 Tax=Achlya hypogyna TaxID=1202772 RepID=A0A1V9Z557_ACHHY|nr:hypothetical protein ACHHYP_02931 [Achlya hypogyna]